MSYEILIGAVSLGVGFGLGYYYATSRAYANTDLSTKSALLQSLTTQVTEMKGKFDAYEKLREQKEKDTEKLHNEKDKRYQDFMESTKKFFETQENIRKENEEKRDLQLTKFSSVIDAFNRTIHGTKTRGIAGEDLLRACLAESIKAKIIKTSLRTENGEVEFAWNLGDGKYIPIDSKLPEISKIMQTITDETQQSEKNKIRKDLIEKLKIEIKRVTKYQNQPNTINKCLLCVPNAAIEFAPEIIELGAAHGVLLCSYEQVFLIGYILAEEYEHLREEGDVGELKDTNKKLLAILKAINLCSDTIERQTKSVLKYNEEVRDKVKEGLRL